MIFKPELAQLVMDGRKTQTRRLDDKGFYVGKIVAVCPGRGKFGIGHIRITEIRHEFLQDISVDDAVAEGMEWRGVFRNEIIDNFKALWNSINKKPGTRWEDNIRVWVYTFEVVKP